MHKKYFENVDFIYAENKRKSKKNRILHFTSVTFALTFHIDRNICISHVILYSFYFLHLHSFTFYVRFFECLSLPLIHYIIVFSSNSASSCISYYLYLLRIQVSAPLCGIRYSLLFQLCCFY